MTFADIFDEVKSRKRNLVMYGRYSTDDTRQSIMRQMNQFTQFRREEEIEDLKPPQFYHDEGVTGGRKGRNGREEWHRLRRDLRKYRCKFVIWVADLQRFRDFADFVSFWDEFLRDNDRVVLYIADDHKIISAMSTLNDQAFTLIMAWQAETFIAEQAKKTKSGINAYRLHNPDKGWGRPRDSSKDFMLRTLIRNQLLNQGKVNWSELSRELGKSRSKLKSDAEELNIQTVAE